MRARRGGRIRPPPRGKVGKGSRERATLKPQPANYRQIKAKNLGLRDED